MNENLMQNCVEPSLTAFTLVSDEALTQVDGGGFFDRLVESVGRLAEGVGVVTGSPLLIVAGRAIYK